MWIATLTLTGLTTASCTRDAPEYGLLGDLPIRPGLNVIVISLDALRADALGCYGHPLDPSPNVDALARESIVFENAYAVAPVTAPAMAAFFTGRLPDRSFRNWRLAKGATLASIFAENGYATAALVNNPNLAAVRGFGRGFESYLQFDGQGDRADQLILDEGLEWIHARRDAPFFLWMHLLDPHSPWDVREESSRFYDPKYDGPWLERGGSRFFEEDPRELARLRSLYEGEVFAIDVAIGRFIRSLRASGALDRSVLVLTSDHGEEFMEHGWLQHGQLYESNVRIPWILHHPDLAQGRRIETRVSQVDLAPTLTALTGLSSDAPFDGRDLRIAAEPVDPLHAFALTLRQFRQISLRRGDMKLIVECGRRAEAGERPTHQLFDLAADPAEANDLAGLRPELTSAMSKELWSRLEAAGCADLRRSAGRQRDRRSEGLTEEEISRLESLGYLQP